MRHHIPCTCDFDQNSSRKTSTPFLPFAQIENRQGKTKPHNSKRSTVKLLRWSANVSGQNKNVVYERPYTRTKRRTRVLASPPALRHIPQHDPGKQRRSLVLLTFTRWRSFYVPPPAMKLDTSPITSPPLPSPSGSRHASVIYQAHSSYSDTAVHSINKANAGTIRYGIKVQ